jgi:hypothetical protein
MYYRKDVLKEKAPVLKAAGLEVRAPRTWEEMIEYCKVLTDPTQGEYGFQSTADAGWHFADLLWQGGVEIVERDATLEWHVTWDSPGTIDTVRFWRELTNTEVTRDHQTSYIAMDAGRSATRLGFNEGKAAFVWSYSSDLGLGGGNTLDPEILGAAPLPAGPAASRWAARCPPSRWPCSLTWRSSPPRPRRPRRPPRRPRRRFRAGSSPSSSAATRGRSSASPGAAVSASVGFGAATVSGRVPPSEPRRRRRRRLRPPSSRGSRTSRSSASSAASSSASSAAASASSSGWTESGWTDVGTASRRSIGSPRSMVK